MNERKRLRAYTLQKATGKWELAGFTSYIDSVELYVYTCTKLTSWSVNYAM